MKIERKGNNYQDLKPETASIRRGSELHTVRSRFPNAYVNVVFESDKAPHPANPTEREYIGECLEISSRFGIPVVRVVGSTKIKFQDGKIVERKNNDTNT